jgi:predicted PurR-regulated permease PerM
MAFGRAGDRSGRAIFTRVVGSERGTEFSHLAVATIRSVAQGVIGVAFIQAILVGVCLLIAGVLWAGSWPASRRCSSPCPRSPTSG